MKAYFFVILTFVSGICFGQVSPIDSLFLSIPFDANAKQTAMLLHGNQNFKLLGIDTTTESLDRIEFAAYEIKEHPIQMRASSISYQKNTLSLFLDSINCECPKWESIMVFNYDSKMARRFAYLDLIERISKCSKAAEEIKTNEDFYGKKFYLSENKTRNIVTISSGKSLNDKSIYISYY